MFATTKTVTIVLIWITCSCCSAAVQDNKGSGARHHEHVRTRSSTRQHRTKHLTADAPLVTTTVAAGPDDDNGGGDAEVGSLRDYLVRRPTNVFRNLLKTSLSVVQTGMDTFEGVSARVYRAITPVRRTRSHTRQRSTDASGPSNPGLARSVGRSVVNMVGTGISGMKEVTDLGLLLGNIGTQKLRSELDGENGNQEIFQMLIKYVASRVGMTTKGNAKQFVDDMGTVSTFIATDDETTKAMSTMMERLMNDPDVCVSMVRMSIAVLQSSPSTSCLLDGLPLSASDIRMLFNVFVGSNGHQMLKTIAGMLSELTTGPQTKEFLEAILGMTTLFSSFADDDKAASESPVKPKTSVIGSLKNFFTGNGDDDENTVKPSSSSSSSKPLRPGLPKARKKKKKKKRKKKKIITPKPEETKETETVISKDMEDWFNQSGDDGFGDNTVVKTGTRSLKQDTDRDAGTRRRRGSNRTTKISNARKSSGEGNYEKQKSKKNDGVDDDERAGAVQNDFAP